MPIAHIAFLLPGNYASDDPFHGLEASLRLFAFGESRGFNGAWIRQRHLERSVSSAATFLAAASQRTQRIELGAAVIQMGYENPFRLAEDLATVDVLSQGRLQVGLSAGPPVLAGILGDRFVDGDPAHVDYSHNRLIRLATNIAAAPLGDESTLIHSPAGSDRARLHPRASGLGERLWYGGGSLGSVEWAGRNGFNLLIGNLNRGETTDQFFEAQLSHLDRFHAHWREARTPRVALGRVIVPLDSADEATRRKYRAYAQGRHARTLAPQGERRTLFTPDLVGRSEEILDRLHRDPAMSRVSELRLELPYDFAEEEYQQILHDFAERIAPELGWKPADRLAA